MFKNSLRASNEYFFDMLKKTTEIANASKEKNSLGKENAFHIQRRTTAVYVWECRLHNVLLTATPSLLSSNPPHRRRWPFWSWRGPWMGWWIDGGFTTRKLYGNNRTVSFVWKQTQCRNLGPHTLFHWWGPNLVLDIVNLHRTVF